MKNLLQETLKLLFPHQVHCPLCGQKTKNKILCSNCILNIKRLNKQEFCRKCGKFININSNLDSQFCCDCSEQRNVFPFDFARAYGPYKGVLKELIHQLKYTGRQSLVFVLADLMMDVVVQDDRFEEVDLIIPVPITSNKILIRRFNQTELLAFRLSYVLKIKLDNQNLIKIKDTKSQSKLSRYQRIVNLKDAFTLKDWNKVKDLNILLLDDIITTGSTVSECSNVLLKAGARTVKVLTLAAGEDKIERGKDHEFT